MQLKDIIKYSTAFLQQTSQGAKCINLRAVFSPDTIELSEAELWKSTPSCRLWIRWTLSTMGRGGSAGQQIRDEILVIMHGHGIKEARSARLHHTIIYMDIFSTCIYECHLTLDFALACSTFCHESLNSYNSWGGRLGVSAWMH